ncbi:MAG TPA: prolyl oligopeptidase family serine peptidase [Pseudonocardiaceae bacterium]
MTTIAPYGTWQSPITPELAAAGGGGPGWLRHEQGAVWWGESRPADNGRTMIVRAAPGQPPADVLPPGWNARNRVHEYGGHPFTILRDGRVAFTSWADQRVWACEPGGEPVPLTPEPERHHGLRYAELITAGDDVWCVRETITGDLPTDVRRELVAIPADGSLAVRVLGASHHFMTGPRPSPDGRYAAWIGWDHPSMPWDETALCVAEVTADGLGPHRVLIGNPREAVIQVEWEADGSLLALTDPDGWWNLHRVRLDGTRQNLMPVAEEWGGPLWRLGARWFAALGDGRYAVLRANRLAVLGADGELTDVDGGYDWWGSTLGIDGGTLATVAGGPRREPAVVSVDLATLAVTELTPQPAHLPPAEYLPQPVEISVAVADGSLVPAYVYPPTNPDFEAPQGERPPYLVHVHGGPTGRNAPLLDLEVAFFTSRGIGVVAPNYGGSTGYGRAFRERLLGQWGVVDVEDCAAVALALAADGAADRERLAIRGGSAGGWTTAASLAVEGPSVYRCGVSMYPILDLTRWTTEGAETHDFESQYLQSIVGPLPEAHDRYVERSPTSHVERLTDPILLLQGLDDQICPPAQAERLVKALAGTGVPHAYLAFEGEQHGFRMASTIIAALGAELSFYGQVFGFETSEVPRLELRR